METQWLYLQTKNPLRPQIALFSVLRSFIDLLEQVLPHGISLELVTVYRDDVMQVFGAKGPFDTLCAVVSDHVQRDPSFIHRIREMLVAKSVDFLAYSLSLPQEYSEHTNIRLWEWYARYVNDYEGVYVYGEPLAYILKDNLPEQLMEYLCELGAEDPETALGVLITDREMSFTSREELALLRRAHVILTHEKWSVLFELPESGLMGYLAENSELARFIDAHVDEWHWVPYDYGVMLWEREHILERLHEFSESSLQEIETRINELEEFSDRIAAQQEQLYGQYGIDDEHRALFEVLQTCAFLLDYKKEVFTQSHVMVRPLLEEMAYRFGVSYELFCYLTLDEIRQFLLEGVRVPDGELTQRMSFSVIRSTPGSHEFLSLDEARALDQEIQAHTAHGHEDSVSEITGIAAFKGRVTGEVQVILDARKIGTFKPGNILVTNMTSPDYITGMKKAAAIVTNEGGLTCHAAIVSRELGVPCIIGTKYATKVLRDGDVVEVDGDRGIVKKL